MWRVTFKSLWAHKIRLTLVSGIVMLGVAFVSGAFVLTGSINKSFDDLFSTVYETTDVVVRGESAGGATDETTIRPPIDATLVERVRSVPGVKDAVGDIQSFALVIGKDGKPISGTGAPRFGGNWTADPELNPFRISAGSPPVAPNQVVLDASTAKIGKFAPGDSVLVLTPNGPAQYSVSGIAKFGTIDSPGGASYALFTTPESQRIFGLENRFSTIGIEALDGVDQNDLRDRVASAVGPNVNVITGEEITKENQDSLKQALSFFNIVLLVFAGISLFVGAFVIQNVFTILVAQRTKELALLRCLGARKRQITNSVIAESFVVGLLASIIGFVVGIGLVAGVLALFEAFNVDLGTTKLVVGSDSIIASLLCGVLVTVVSAIIPARRASKVPPLAAMRDVAVETDRLTRFALVFGFLSLVVDVVLIGVGLFSDMDRSYIPIGLGAALTFVTVAILAPTFAKPATRILGWPVAKLRGVPGSLARQNAMRSPRRTSSTAAALMIGVALVTLLTVLFASVKATFDSTVDRSFTGDFVVSGPSSFQGGLGFEVEGALRSVPGVQSISPQRMVNLSLDGKQTFASAVDTKSFNDLYDVQVSSGNLNALGNSGIALAEGVAEEKRLRVGDNIPVRFAGTGEEKTLRVGAIYGADEAVGNYLVDISAYTPGSDERLDQAIFVKVADNANADAVKSGINQAVAGYPGSKVEDLQGLKDSISSQINTFLNVLYGLLALAVIIALLGIATTLSLAVFERTHEIGLLRAVGMSRRQLRSVIRWEAVIVSVFGALLGMILGIAFAQALISALADEGLNETVLPAGRLAAILLVAGAAGVLAAIWPARRAARMNVLKAIAES